MRIEVAPDLSGTRIDVFAAEVLNLSRSAVQKLLEEGAIRVNGTPAKKNHRVSAGELVEAQVPEPKETQIPAQDIDLDIVYEDSDIVVVNKPRGMVVHPAAGHSENTLVNALLYRYGPELSDINGKTRPGIVHRLDRDSSGLIVAAKNNRAHIMLAQQLKDRSMVRIYEAVVRGGFKEDSGRIDAPIGRHPMDRKRMAVTDKNSRDASTDWEVVTRYYGVPGISNIAHTHVRCSLITGRTHQIRVHMAHIGHPIVGDKVYGIGRDEFEIGGQCLHSKAVEFVLPASADMEDPGRIRIESDLPDYFIKVLTRLGHMG